MRVASLAQLDAAIADSSAPLVVPGLPLDVGGVDPLGMRQLNFELMDRCIPGLNNAAWRLRPYTLMAWSWWHLARVAERDGHDELPVVKAREFVDRIEVMFQAGHLMAGEYDSLPSADTVRARVVTPGGIDFSTAAWRTWHGRRREQGSLMAPVSYGPSVKEGLGMGYLRAARGAFVPVDEVMPAVLALDARLQPVIHDAPFASLDCGWVSADDMAAIHPLWSLGELDDDEVEVGRRALLGAGSASARGRTLAFARDILRGADAPMSADEIRVAAASTGLGGDLKPTADLWRALQARQLFRVSLEGLLNWVLAATSGGPRDLEGLVAELAVDAGVGPDGRFADWLAGPTIHDGVDGVASPVTLVYAIDAARQWQRPDLSLLGLRVSLAVCRTMGAPDDLFGRGARDRLPMRHVMERLDGAGALSIADALALILSELVVGQHVFVAVGRSGDDTQRLRVVLDEGGWVALQGAGHSNPTPDRLSTLLELAADCRLVRRASDWRYVSA